MSEMPTNIVAVKCGSERFWMESPAVDIGSSVCVEAEYARDDEADPLVRLNSEVDMAVRRWWICVADSLTPDELDTMTATNVALGIRAVLNNPEAGMAVVDGILVPTPPRHGIDAGETQINKPTVTTNPQFPPQIATTGVYTEHDAGDETRWTAKEIEAAVRRAFRLPMAVESVGARIVAGVLADLAAQHEFPEPENGPHGNGGDGPEVAR